MMAISKIQVRPIHFRFPDTIERYWLGDSAYNTHLLNSLTLLLPDIERYMNHIIKQQLPHITDSQLQPQVRAFVAQESQHASQHTHFWKNLQQQGYCFDGYVRYAQGIWRRLTQHGSLILNLAIVAGGEHLTSLMAEVILTKRFLDPAEPNLKALFEWHAAEEIEHQVVAFEVLQSATRNYGVRLLGLVISNLLMLGLMNWGIILLLQQDKKWSDRQVWQNLMQFWFFKEKLLFRAIISGLHYARPSFHPSQKDNQALAARVLGSLAPHPNSPLRL
ncbi:MULTISPECIES: metal-dependent hydrolase [Trichocoleus]|uniref:Metal-dependent hydrolase n=1 Tax=Trichocoleus desertorum GB2-A4 TaxID=2933944 RepID=A0ABV0J3G1_9CYAN|nr:metal-dependent hydrolase [Trichocoleus sp. FACHB-46]MBD1861660.1 metal-dependent hydrolase [Trichocoleus sp. FACHB-46]